MSFNAPINGEIQFQRLDTGAKVAVSFNAGVVPAAATLMPALNRILAGSATEEERISFSKAWQERVGEILENADHPELVICA